LRASRYDGTGKGRGGAQRCMEKTASEKRLRPREECFKNGESGGGKTKKKRFWPGKGTGFEKQET